MHACTCAHGCALDTLGFKKAEVLLTQVINTPKVQGRPPAFKKRWQSCGSIVTTVTNPEPHGMIVVNLLYGKL